MSTLILSASPASRRLARFFSAGLVAIVALVTLAVAAMPARAESFGVQDNAGFFTPDTVQKANQIISSIRTGDNRDVLVVTSGALTDSQQTQLDQMGKESFYVKWADDIGRENKVNGVVILLTDKHLQIAVGNKTREHAFTLADRDELSKLMLKTLHGGDKNQAILDGLGFIQQRMNEHPAPAGAAPGNGGAIPGNSTPGYTPAPIGQSVTHGFGISTWLCVGVGLLVLVFIVIGAANRRSGYGGGYGAPPPGGYPPGYTGGGYGGGGGYGPGYGGGGGGGFGRGILGGLLGGALGSWGYNELANRNNPATPNTPATGGGDYAPPANQNDSSYSSTGGDYASPGGSDSASTSGGGDYGGSSGGGDFGGGGGGGDFGGGGGDSGGGGGGGGDF